MIFWGLLIQWCVLCTDETYVLIGTCVGDVQLVHIVAVNSLVCIWLTDQFHFSEYPCSKTLEQILLWQFVLGGGDYLALLYLLWWGTFFESTPSFAWIAGHFWTALWHILLPCVAKVVLLVRPNQPQCRSLSVWCMGKKGPDDAGLLYLCTWM